MECLLPYLRMVTVPHIMVGLERTLDYRGVGLARFHCTTYSPSGVTSVPGHARSVPCHVIFVPFRPRLW